MKHHIHKLVTLASLACSSALFSLSSHAAELSFWSWRVEDKAFYEQIAKQYKAKTGDEIKFTAYKNTEYPTVLSAALAGGGGPDIIHARAYGGLSNLADAGYLVPLTPAQVPELARMSDNVLAGATGFKPPHDKTLYGVPFATQSLGIYVNPALLAKNGITTMPKTWDEFKAVCRQLKAKGVTALANGVKDAPVLEQMFGVVAPGFYGGTPFFKDVMVGRKHFTAPEFVRAIDEVVSLREFMPPNALGIAENEARTLFAMGQAAFFMSGTWNIDTIKGLNPKLEVDFVPAPPVKPGAPTLMSTFADGNYAINANSKNREAALRFVKFLASKEFGQQFTDELRQISAVPDVFPRDPLLAQISRTSQQHGTPFIMLVGFRYQNPNGSVLLRDGLQKLMQGQGSSQALANELQTGLSMWHLPFQK